jgi:hypothetical protein
MKLTTFIFLVILLQTGNLFAQVADSTEIKSLEKLRTESGVDPTRVQSKAGYTFLIYDPQVSPGQINNRLSLNLGVNRWSFSGKYEIISKLSAEPGNGFSTSAGDIKFSVLNAFYVKGKNALAASAELSMPTGKPGYGSQYLSLSPSITYSYTINTSLFFAIQPQYTFQLMKDSLYPNLSVLTIRAFLAKFTKKGYFFVFEPRPIFDFGNDNFDFIVSPIIGKALGAGFNLIYLMEIPTKQATLDSKGILYQFGFNKSF